MHPLPQGHNLRGVWAASASEAFAVGEYGTMLHLEAGQWQALDCSTLAHLNGVWGSGPTNVWAVGTSGTVVWTDGKQCTKSTSMPQDLNGIWGHSATAIYAVGDKGSVYFAGSFMGFAPHTTCGSKDLRAVWGAGPSDLFLVGDSGTVIQLQGKTCNAATPITTDDLLAVWGSGSTDIHAAGTQGALLHFSGSWTVVPQFANVDLLAVWGTGPSDVHLAGKDGALYHLGTKWQKATSPTKVAVNAIHGSGGEVHAVGAQGAMLRHKAGAWVQNSILLTDPDAAIHAIQGSSPTEIMATGDYGAALRFDGKTWSATAAGGNGHVLQGVWAAGGGSYWAAGYKNSTPWLPVTLYFNGTAWSNVVVTFTNCMLYDIWGHGDQVFAVGGTNNSNGVKILEKTGTAGWQLIQPGAKAMGSGIWGRSATDFYVVGKAFDCPVLHRDGTSWNVLSSSGTTGICINYNHVWGTGPSTVFFAGLLKSGYGTVRRLQGTSWKDWTLGGKADAIWGTNPSNVYVVGAAWQGASSLFRFDGVQWKAEAVGTGIDLRDVWGTSATDLYITGSGGAILHKGK